MGWVSAFSGRLAGRCGCARCGSLIGHHCGESTFNVLDGLGEGGVCPDEVVGGGVLLDGCVGKVVQLCGHLLRLFHLRSLVGTKGGFACCHVGDVTHFGKCSHPVNLPVCPCVLNCWSVLPFSPAEHHVAAGKRVFGAGGDHQFVGDRDARVGGEDLTLLLFAIVSGQGGAGVDAGVEFGHVVNQVGLADLGVHCENGLNKCTEVDTVKSFCWIVKDGVVDVIDGGSKLVTSDGQYEPVGCPCFARGDVGGL
jgi:hypothetical protein